MLTIIVTYHCKDNQRDEFYKALCELNTRGTSLQEAGCLRYDYAFAAESPNDLLLVEQWEDHPTHDAHCKSETFAKLQALKPQYCESSSVIRIDH